VTGDWLSLPAEPEKNSEAPEVYKPLVVFGQLPSLVPAIVELNPPSEVVTDVAPPAAEDRNRLIESIWQGLTSKQRRYLDELEKQNFNNRATLRKLGEVGPCTSTVSNWKRQKDFAFILKVRKTAQAMDALDKNNLVLHAAHIRDEALEPKPILHQGAPTGYTENEPDTALRANEQLARLGGHLKQDDGPAHQQGPAFLIQVVQRDGGVIDVTPRNVTIDLPAPGGT
jgi:hypothetical protein